MKQSHYRIFLIFNILVLIITAPLQVAAISSQTLMQTTLTCPDIQNELYNHTFSAAHLLNATNDPDNTSLCISDTSTNIYLAIGDSITKGVGMSDPADCFVSQLSDQLKESYPNLVTYNLGKKGDTISDTLTLISDPSNLPLLQQATIDSLTTGGNDVLALATAAAKSITSTDYTNADKIPSMVKKESTAKLILHYLKTDQAQKELSKFIDAFADEYHQLLTYIQQENPNCTIITQSIYNPISANDYPSLAQCVDLVLQPINECLREETLNTNQQKTLYLDTYTLFHSNTNLYIRTSEDDIHPTKEGHHLIATELSQMLTNPEPASSNRITASNSNPENAASDIVSFPYAYIFIAMIIGITARILYYFLHKRKKNQT